MRRETDRQVRALLARAESRRACAFARTQHGHRALERRAEAGALLRVSPRLFARPEYWGNLDRDDRDLHVLRAEGLRHPEWVFAGPSAALAYGLSVSYSLRGKPCLLTSSKAHTCESDQVTRLVVRDGRPTVVNGLRVTSLCQTALDCLRTMSFRDGLALADSAARRYPTRMHEMEEFLRAPHRGMRGLGRARVTLAHADPRADSGGESILRAALLELGYRFPELQLRVEDPLVPGRILRIDMAWNLGTQEAPRYVFCEFDGKGKRGDTLSSVLVSLSRERIRESHLTLLGVPVMRLGWAELSDDSLLCHLLDAFGIPRDATPLVVP